MAKTKKQKLIKKMDDLWSRIVRKVGRCEVCGCIQGLEAHHLIERGNHYYRFDIHNGLCLCTSHHQFSADKSAHGRKGSSMCAVDRFLEWFKEYKPEQWKWYQENKNNKPMETLRMVFYEEAYIKLRESETQEWN